MKKKFSMGVFTEITIFAAIGVVLDLLQNLVSGFIWPLGGSVGFAMIVVYIMSIRHGVLAGFLTGLIMGVLDLLDGWYAISDTWYNVFLQMCLDYFIAYAMVCLTGLFRPLWLKFYKTKKRYLILSIACLVGALAKFLCHYFSGILYWNVFDTSKYLNVWVYSFCYNFPYVIISAILSLIILIIADFKIPWLLNKNVILDEEEEQIEQDETH